MPDTPDTTGPAAATAQDEGGDMAGKFAPSRATVNLWRSWISWRITATVFITILVVQICVMVLALRNLEADMMDTLRQRARAVISVSLEQTRDQMTSPLRADAAQRLFGNTVVRGVTVYALDGGPLALYGERTRLSPRQRDLTSLRDGGDRYDVLFSPGDMGRPYYFAVSTDAVAVDPALRDYMWQNLLIFVLMSGFVTSVLMLALGNWLLEPIMILRGNLLSAAQSPERPMLRRARDEVRDEIGVAVRIANDLIRQNASNLKRLKAQAEDKIHRLAYYDGLTGLPNRTFFIEKLDEQIKAKVVAEDKRLAIMCVDVDHFKDINDSMGHEVGDKMLEAVGRRLVKALPDDTMIARASADEFLVMAVLKPEHGDSEALVERVFTAMSEPVSIMHERFQVRVSVGVAQSPDDGVEARQIMKNADIALNRAKEEGRDTVRYYSQEFDRAVQARFQMLRSLRSAVDENQLRLFYQPQFDLKTGAIIGAEALLRWWKPDNSREGGVFIPPNEFIPVAEQSGLIVPLGEWVLRTACETNKKWQEQGLPPIRVAVNISGVQFHRADIVQLVGDAVRETRLGAQWLELEITESVFMENTQSAIDILDRLHSIGVEIAVDDFGTGYSSLSYLRRFPIDRIKIDQSFIRNALVNQDDGTIARTIINLGHSLGLKVIAEGVETIEHEEFLKREGCDEAQGYKYAKPLPEDKFVQYLLDHSRAMAKATKLAVVEDGSKKG